MPILFIVKSLSASHPLLADLYVPYGFFLLESIYEVSPPSASILGYTYWETVGVILSSPLIRIATRDEIRQRMIPNLSSFIPKP